MTMLVTLILVMSWGELRGQDIIIQRHFKGDIYTAGEIFRWDGTGVNNNNIDGEKRMSR